MPIRFTFMMLDDPPLEGRALRARSRGPSTPRLSPHAQTFPVRFPVAPKSVRRRPAPLRSSDMGVTNELADPLHHGIRSAQDPEQHQTCHSSFLKAARARPQGVGATGDKPCPPAQTRHPHLTSPLPLRVPRWSVWGGTGKVAGLGASETRNVICLVAVEKLGNHACINIIY